MTQTFTTDVDTCARCGTKQGSHYNITGHNFISSLADDEKVKEAQEKVLTAAKEDISLRTSEKYFQEVIDQALYEIDLMRKMPRQKVAFWKRKGLERARTLMEKQVSVMNSCLIASKAGFSQSVPPSNWYMGFLDKPNGVRGNYKIYSRAMPPQAIAAYGRALATGAFDLFTVHSPDITAFQSHAAVVRRTIDPLLIGWVNATPETDSDGNYRQIVAKASGAAETYPFLITAWDLAKDLEHAKILLAPPAIKI